MNGSPQLVRVSKNDAHSGIVGAFEAFEWITIPKGFRAFEWRFTYVGACANWDDEKRAVVTASRGAR